MGFTILGTGSALPKRSVSNDELSEFLDTSDEWIQERTGIIRRHIVEADTTVSMAAQAAEKALESAKMLPEEIEEQDGIHYVKILARE